jgi:hypothetical protein
MLYRTLNHVARWAYSLNLLEQQEVLVICLLLPPALVNLQQRKLIHSIGF